MPMDREYIKIRGLLPRYTRGTGISFGCAARPFPHFVNNGTDVQLVADALPMVADNALDFVFVSFSEACAVNEWGRVLKPGGHLVLYQPGIAVGTFQRLLDDSCHIWTLLVDEERGEATGEQPSRFMVACRGKVANDSPTGKTACVVRMGGFGDMLQTALVLPGLKAQGFHVTVMTTPTGKEIIKDDPHVDDWFLVDSKQIPNEDLAMFWAMQAPYYDRFINLSESVEGTLLPTPERISFAWPHDVRKKMLNKNYNEFTCELAAVPLKPCRLFYPTDAERTKANDLRSLQHPFTIVWALAGSSLHKFTPHMDTVIARIMLDCPEARVLLVGDEACRLLEQGWENEPRVSCLSGKLSIRETLALAQVADLVIGPETGVLNAVSFDEQVSKVILLSHSSPNNLTKHWTKTQALTPVDCACYPCHRLHYTDYFCDVDEQTAAARCAVNISPAVMWDAVKKVYDAWRRKK